MAESRKAPPTSRKLKKQQYSTSVQCASNYGTDEICCNQPGTPSTTANQCPVQYPACSDYVFNNHWGTCVSSAGCYSSAVAGTINCAQLPCFNQNTGYSSLQDAENACNANSDCMYIMQFTDGDWYLRSADDLSTQGGAFLAGDGNFILTRKACPPAAGLFTIGKISASSYLRNIIIPHIFLLPSYSCSSDADAERTKVQIGLWHRRPIKIGD